MDIVHQAAGKATLRLLRKFGREVHVLDNCCCGLPAHSYGDIDAAKKLAAKNLDVLASGEFDAIVTDCSSCASFLKKYPDIFADDKRHEQARTVASLFKDMVELIDAEVGVSCEPRSSERRMPWQSEQICNMFKA